MSKHTAKPWRIKRTSSGQFITAIGPCAADEYAGSVWLDVSEEDARLIASAPELLSACWNIVLASDDAEHAAAKEQARAAIKKATGE